MTPNIWADKDGYGKRNTANAKRHGRGEGDGGYYCSIWVIRRHETRTPNNHSLTLACSDYRYDVSTMVSLPLMRSMACRLTSSSIYKVDYEVTRPWIHATYTTNARNPTPETRVTDTIFREPSNIFILAVDV